MNLTVASAKRLVVTATALSTLVVAGWVGNAAAQNSAPNPYETVTGWAKMPAGREWGSTSAVFPAPDGKHIWVAERCGANSCVGSDLDPVMLFDENGKMVRSFGAGLITWPHGIFVDAENNVWIADGVGYRAVPEGVGHTVRKFSAEGELLMTIGREGQPGNGEQTLRKPSDVLVAPNGNIFVVDSHDASERPVLNSRVVKFDPEGRYITSWGSFGSEAGEFRYPHALAMDSEGRLFVGDRYNNRIQIFTQEGEHLATWTQFGRPSGIFIDENDTIYVADSESNTGRNPGFKRGIRVGSAKDGFVREFIPDPILDQDESGGSGAEGVAVDAKGNIYGAQVSPPGLWKYVRK